MNDGLGFNERLERVTIDMVVWMGLVTSGVKSQNWYCKVVGHQAGTERVTGLVSQGHCGLSDLFCYDCSCIYFM